MTATFETLCHLDELLVGAHHHPLTPWWRGQLERFYFTPAKAYVGQVGRGGAKSNTSTKVGLNETLFGDWAIPPGERHYWAYVSKSKDEASQRLMLIQSFLRALGIKFDAAGDEIALVDLPRGFRVFACQVGAVSGFRCFGYSADELAKWQAGADHANPAAEVCASLNAMCITHPGARKLLISSPFGVVDYHYDRFGLGDTSDQIVANAPSWIANPGGITEETTRKAEPDPRIWSREYAAIPSAGIASAFDTDAVLRAFREITPGQGHQPVCIVDASSGGGDAFTWAIAGYVQPYAPNVPQWLEERVPRKVCLRVNGENVTIDSPTETILQPARDAHGRHLENPEFTRSTQPLLTFHKIGSFEGRFAGSISGTEIVRRIAADCRAFGVRTVIGDQREAFFLGTEFSRHSSLKFVSIAWTNTNKQEAVTRLRRLMAEDLLVLPPARDKLRKELLSYQERITASGAITYSARGTGHDDEASLLVTCALAELERLVPGSPAFIQNYRHEVSGR